MKTKKTISTFPCNNNRNQKQQNQSKLSDKSNIVIERQQNALKNVLCDQILSKHHWRIKEIYRKLASISFESLLVVSCVRQLGEQISLLTFFFIQFCIMKTSNMEHVVNACCALVFVWKWKKARASVCENAKHQEHINRNRMYVKGKLRGAKILDDCMYEFVRSLIAAQHNLT